MKFAHRGLKRLYERGDSRRVNPDVVARIRRILAALDDATEPHIDLPGLRLHRLKGDHRRLWSVRVSGEWRIVFRFDASQAVDVDLIDYH